MRPVELIGSNGDRIDLCTDSIYVAPGAQLGVVRRRVLLNEGIRGSRYDRSQVDILRSALTIRCFSADPAELDRLRSRVVDALRSRVNGVVWLIVERGDGTRRAQIGRDVGGDPTTDDAERAYTEIPMVLESADSPFWVSLEAEEISVSIGVPDGTLWVGEQPLNAPIPIGWPWALSGRRFEDAEAQTLALQNPGGLETWAEWELDGPATAFQLVDERGGAVFRWDGALLAGQTLRVVTDPEYRDVRVDGELAWDGVSLASQMSPILPNESPIQVTVEGGTFGTTDVRSSLFSRFASS